MHILYNQKLMRMELVRVELEARRDAAEFSHVRKTYEAINFTFRCPCRPTSRSSDAKAYRLN
ncbi:hypothetical protein GCM10010967_57930 [Dyadobacter beijingensis]|uniref:Uncharacterized protein n=1 Tax=Dyadobacter beijingensis TaxID=365489 RepID=A0ABQ2IPL2_9BACT|nr:hypothetical protein GCM10010967_57930 [Dyadobacter beijingensis]